MENTERRQINEHEPVLYVYYVYGTVPAFMPSFAFRREKHFKTAGMKIIKCPYCQKPFKIINETERVEIYPISRKTQVAVDETEPCRNCRRVVGVIFIKAQTA